MLQAVQALHEERIAHGDLQPASFVFVKGELKLVDFGLFTGDFQVNFPFTLSQSSALAKWDVM